MRPMVTVNPCRSVKGTVYPPGDKSISHRFAMLGAIANGKTRLSNFACGQDCRSTLNCIRQLGVAVDQQGGEVTIHGVGMRGLRAAPDLLDAGNSGTTIRLLSGILAAQSFESWLSGDDSLCGRPMNRIIEPLRRMGAVIEARAGGFAPLHVIGAPLQGIEFRPETPSAQVKSCVLLAGLYANGTTTVLERISTRDHTERALKQFGADIRIADGTVSVNRAEYLAGVDMVIPGDLSSAIFWLVAAAILPGSSLHVAGVGLNPSRSAVIDLLCGWGADLEVSVPAGISGEVSGELRIRYTPNLGAGGQLVIDHRHVPLIIDEIPALVILGAKAPHGMSIRGADELRVKESDRLQAISENLRNLGVDAKEVPDGLDVPGNQQFRGARLDSFGDHRIAMACAIAALAADGPCEISRPECADISYPGFFETLDALAVR